jgi:phage shock protein A
MENHTKKDEFRRNLVRKQKMGTELIFEEKNSDLSGMDTAQAKEYILHYVTTLKLTQKKLDEVEQDLSKWNLRIKLAHSKGESGLVLEAERETDKIKARKTELSGEVKELQILIEKMLRQLPDITGQERTGAFEETARALDILEQELLIAAGHLPGDEKEVKINRTMQKLENDTIAETELALLKAKMENKTGDE